MGRLIFEERDLTTASEQILKGVDRAVLAAAFKIRDNMRAQFLGSAALYKNKTSKYDALANGIMVGKLNNSQVRVHALGSKEQYNTYKTRFFVGGTEVRSQTKKAGQSIKPYTKGYIQSNDAVDKGLVGGQDILNNFIKNVIDNG